MHEESVSIDRLRRFAYLNVAYLVFVILWGAWVRISFSGDGCGDHWPLCRGSVLPDVSALETRIELFHRVTSALCGPFALGLAIGAYRRFPVGHAARRLAVLGIVLIVLEGLFGAALVRLRLVAHDTSIARAYVVALHLVNTFALLVASVAFAERCRTEAAPALEDRAPRWLVALVASALVLVGCTGAVTALGDTLFPAQDLRSGLVADFDPSSHPFLQLRAFHPLIALGTAALLLYVASTRLASPRRQVAIAARALAGVVVMQVGVGFLAILTGAPTALQLLHLALADLVVIFVTALFLREGDAGVIPAPR